MKQVTVDNVFEDDHLPCVAFTVNGKRAELWWSGFDIVAALEYANESPRAMEKVKRILALVDNQHESLERDEEEGMDLNNDSIREVHTPIGFLIIKRS